MPHDTKIDWFSTTAKGHDGMNIPYIDGQKATRKQALYGYDTTLLYPNGVRIMWHSRKEEMGTHIQYDGSTLEHFRAIGLDIQEVMRWHHERQHNPRRVDMAVDITGLQLSADLIRKLWLEKKVVTRAKQTTYIESTGKGGGGSFYIGNYKKRKKLLRCYDKGAELGIDLDLFRLELQCSGNAAKGANLNIVNSQSLPETIVQSINGFAHFAHPAIETELGTEAIRIMLDYGTSREGRYAWLYSTIIPTLARMNVDEGYDVAGWVHDSALKQAESIRKSEQVD